MLHQFFDLKIGTKLGLGFGFCLMLAAVMSGLMLHRLSDVDRLSDRIAQDVLPGATAMGQMGMEARAFRIREIRHITSPKAQAKTESEMDEAVQKIAGLMDGYAKRISEPEDRKNFETLTAAWSQYRGLHDQFLPISRSGDVKASMALYNGAMKDVFKDQVSATMDTMLLWNKEHGTQLVQQAKAENQTLKQRITLMLLVGLGIGALAGGLLTRLLRSALQEMTRVAQHLAQGDIAQQVSIRSKDEVGQMAEAFRQLIAYQQEMASVAGAIAEGDLTRNIEPQSENDVLGNAFVQMVGGLRALVCQVSDNADSVTHYSQQLAATSEVVGQAADSIARSIHEVAMAAEQSAHTSEDMAHGSEQQAHSAMEATGAMTRLQTAVTQALSSSDRQQSAVLNTDAGIQQAAAAVTRVAQSAEQMTGTAQEAAEVAQNGGQAVEQTIASMARIREQVESASEKVRELGQKGQQIGAIVETIEQIAEQTNLLALNAAIEAARAGEHGKGFAVVADEVRKLAERATSATKEIAALIGGVQADVETVVDVMDSNSREVAEGASRSEEAGSALVLILQSAERVQADAVGVNQIAAEVNQAVRSALDAVQTVRTTAEEGVGSIRAIALGAEQVSGAIASVASVSERTAAGAEEMSASAQEVSASVQQVSSSVQQQTAGVEEVTAMAASLEAMAAQLQRLIQQFQLEEESPVGLRLAA